MAHVVIAVGDGELGSVLGCLLAAAGHRVSEARDGRAALAALRNTAADLLVVDPDVPGTGGLGLLRAARQLGAGTRTLLAGGAPTGAAELEARALGVDDYAPAPVDAVSLAARVEWTVTAGDETLRRRRAIASGKAALQLGLGG